MIATKEKPSCDDVRLDVLLHGDEDSAEFQQAAYHVESCPSCQDRLTDVAGEPEAWAEARNMLRPEGHGRSPGTLRLDFLAPPSHPEMLGRLGRYEVEHVIGAGGMGVVLKGFDTELNRPVAIKVLAPHLAHSGAARQRFAREARAAAAVVHEHVVAIHNVETAEETPFLVMQYVPGRSLADRVEQDGPLEVEEILRIGMQAAAGLAAAHAQGVIHRDIKPANILLENGVERALLTDFGLARAAEDASLTHSGIITGTPYYMSPEQARSEPLDARSDLFSLGSVLYFMATGHSPFRAEQAMAVLHRVCHSRHRPVWEVRPDVSDELADVIDRLLEKKPSRRYSTASDVQQALAAALSQVQQPRRWRAGPWLRRLRRQRGKWSAAAALIVMVVIAAALWLSPWRWPGAKVGAQGNGAPAPSSTPGDTTEGAPSLAKTQTTPAARRLPATATTPAATANRDIQRPPVEPQADFVDELVAIHQSLARIAYGPHPETIALRANADAWIRELRAMDAETARFERAWPLGANDSPPVRNPKGEKR
jgi:hypothetical protein